MVILKKKKSFIFLNPLFFFLFCEYVLLSKYSLFLSLAHSVVLFFFNFLSWTQYINFLFLLDRCIYYYSFSCILQVLQLVFSFSSSKYSKLLLDFFFVP